MVLDDTLSNKYKPILKANSLHKKIGTFYDSMADDYVKLTFPISGFITSSAYALGSEDSKLSTLAGILAITTIPYIIKKGYEFYRKRREIKNSEQELFDITKTSEYNQLY